MFIDGTYEFAKCVQGAELNKRGHMSYELVNLLPMAKRAPMTKLTYTVHYTTQNGIMLSPNPVISTSVFFSR